jgi:hypothetical protein
MKSLLLIFALGLTFTSSFWRTSRETEKYCAEMRDGVMVLLKDGMVVTSDVTLNDSTKITTNCVVIKKDGSNTNLKDGECIISDTKKQLKKDKSEK